MIDIWQLNSKLLGDLQRPLYNHRRAKALYEVTSDSSRKRGAITRMANAELQINKLLDDYVKTRNSLSILRNG